MGEKVINSSTIPFSILFNLIIHSILFYNKCSRSTRGMNGYSYNSTWYTYKTGGIIISYTYERPIQQIGGNILR
jgi:hypothetical protein